MSMELTLIIDCPNICPKSLETILNNANLKDSERIDLINIKAQTVQLNRNVIVNGMIGKYYNYTY